MPARSKLIVHVGHGKTGSSYLQAAFRGSADLLGEHGLRYLLPDDDDYARPEAQITSGFEGGLFDDVRVVRDLLRSGRLRADGGAYLISSELLFHEFATSDSAPEVVERLNAAHFDLELILFIRDPVAHASSLWQQFVKRSGSAEPLDAFFARYSVPVRVEKCLQRANDLPATQLTLRNYSRHRGSLLREMEHLLPVPAGTIRTPSVEQINRSMSAGELAIQLRLNERLGRSGWVLADPVAELLPEIDVEPVHPDVSVQRSMLERLRPELERINAKIPVAERYQLVVEAGACLAEPYAFSEAQLRLIADRMADLSTSGGREGALWNRVRRRLGRRLRSA